MITLDDVDAATAVALDRLHRAEKRLCVALDRGHVKRKHWRRFADALAAPEIFAGLLALRRPTDRPQAGPLLRAVGRDADEAIAMVEFAYHRHERRSLPT